jgi:hypothetical protein
MFKVIVFINSSTSQVLQRVKDCYVREPFGVIVFKLSSGAEYSYVAKNIIGWSVEPAS